MRAKEDPARVRARTREWYQNNKERAKAYVAEWQRRNPAKTLAYAKKWREAHKEAIYLRTKRWREANRERRNTQQVNRRARVANVDGSHTTEEWETLKRQHCFRCPGCRRAEPDIKLTRDHIIPVSKGGSNFITNIQPLCGPCNSTKNAKMPAVQYPHVIAR